MNNTFDIRRFGRLYRKVFLDNKTQFLAMGLIPPAISILMYLFVLFLSTFPTPIEQSVRRITSFSAGDYEAFAFLALYFGIILSPSIFRKYARSLKEHILLTPASTFEKWLVPFVTIFIVYGIIYILTFTFTYIGFEFIFHPEENAISSFTYFIKRRAGGLATAYVLTSFSFFNILFFKRRQSIKAFITGLIIFGFLFIFFIGSDKLFELEDKIVDFNDNYLRINVILNSYINYVVPIGLLICSYFKLKEREI